MRATIAAQIICGCPSDPGEVNHLITWFGQAVELDGYFLEPAGVVRGAEAAGFAVYATLIRSPLPGIEYPSRRC